MNLLIVPYESVGPIEFDMDRQRVREAIGLEFNTFLKTPSSAIPVDNFIGHGIHVYYSESDRCVAVEMAAPADPVFDNQHLLGQNFHSLLKYFQGRDSEVEIDDCGLTSKLFGIGLYAPGGFDSANVKVEGVIAFSKDYYD